MELPSLFPTSQLPADARPAGLFAAVALELGLDHVLDYAVPRELASSIRVGQRVKVPLGRGNRPTRGFVIRLCDTPATSAKIKPILAIEDDRALLAGGLMELALWISRYYCAPLGVVAETIIPAAVKDRVGVEYTAMLRRTAPRQQIEALAQKTRAPKRRAILQRLLAVEHDQPVELSRIAADAGASVPTVRKLAKAGLISISSEALYQAERFDVGQAILPDAPAHGLNQEQQRVYDELRPRLGGGFSVNLLHGVTGSGKTEVYLRCIRDVVLGGRQAIVLVPEIALTPQTVRRFTERFGRVAVLHSGLSAGARHRFWRQIMAGEADVVVGARSAVFAPLPRLGMIVVDEEHEFSYKQDTAPRYQGRDVAIKRGQIEKIPILLGSATPSLESWHRAARPAESRGAGANAGAGGSNYHLLSLTARVRGLSLPAIELVDLRREARIRPRGIHLISHRLEALLHQTLREDRQAILLLNRRGYSSYICCPACAHVMQCRYCDATMTYHRAPGAEPVGGRLDQAIGRGQLHCHYCLAVNPLPGKCPECGKNLTLFGLGTQRVEEELARKFPELEFERVDSDTMRGGRHYEQVLTRFARGEVRVLLGTQMIAKGLDFPRVTLVGIISGDTALSLPDFRAAERTFQLITQVAGRAGRGDSPGRVILQTFQADDPTIQAALRHDYGGFVAAQLASRAQMGLPPLTRMARIIVRDQDEAKLRERTAQLAAALRSAAGLPDSPPPDMAQQFTLRKTALSIEGPAPCSISRIAGHHRWQILLFSPSPTLLQRTLARARQQKAFAESDKIAVDVDPASLL